MPSLTSRTGDYVQRRKNIMPMARLLNHFYAKLMKTSNKSRKKRIRYYNKRLYEHLNQLTITRQRVNISFMQRRQPDQP